MTDYRTIAELVLKRFSEPLTADEEQTLNEWIAFSPAHREWFRQINDEEHLRQLVLSFRRQDREASEARVLERLTQQLFVDTRVETGVPVYDNERVYDNEGVYNIDRRGRNRGWWKYAAAAVVVLTAGVYLWNTQKEKPQNTTLAETTTSVPLTNDVQPGGNRATLKLADGQTIVLDSGAYAKGPILKQGVRIVNDAEKGLLAYTPTNGHANVLQTNTVTTPRGGQYQLILADGTKVWLNAESSITYPTAFTGKQRHVSIVGEAYFEVAKDPSKPFIVTVKNNFDIEVLGTHFNVNAYADEKIKSTTLLEGSVRINAVRKNAVHTSLELRPGQQGQLDLSADRLSLAVPKDPTQAVAWTNGVFNFNDVALADVMRQLARWYDVEVAYEKGVPDIVFYGKMQRSLQLSQVLTALGKIGVQFRIDGKKIIVTR